MSPEEIQEQSGDLKQRRLMIDNHYTADELEWNRIVGPSGVAMRLLEEMATLSRGVFRLDEIERIPQSDGEKFEFSVDGEAHTLHLDYTSTPTSTLLKGLRHLFAEINKALRRAGVDWRFVLIRDKGSRLSSGYNLVLAPRTSAVRDLRDRDVVAGIDLKEYEFGR